MNIIVRSRGDPKIKYFLLNRLDAGRERNKGEIMGRDFIDKYFVVAAADILRS